MAVATSTVRCYDCEEIKDVVTTEEPWLAMEKGWVPSEFYCDESTSHHVELWKHPRKCPECDRSMIIDKTYQMAYYNRAVGTDLRTIRYDLMFEAIGG